MSHLFHEHYIDANSSEGYRLRKCFDRMKGFPPLIPAEAPNSSIPSKPNSVLTLVDPAEVPTQFPHTTAPVLSSNPLLPRVETCPDPRTQAGSTLSTSSLNMDDFTEVTARRTPANPKALIYQTADGWKAMGPFGVGKRDGDDIFYSWEKRLWTYVKDVQ
ncbi:hypothetical protein AYO20_04287 [Fonsecaea nubica]|uniref:Uncharacterized protein n=1 Tax=Fonsecaea nubica TaxID=856822 RepID=A0A178D5A2_9EURO|nr:hypothetical protein AYO20_04287 [Fonsecaea nubica]OAL36391.1 hypothetical protein AYO20_04287 [Fonsecaea nubica]